MTRRRRRRRGARPASPPAALEDDDLLRKIFLLLPPQPSSIPRLSVVCKQWRDVVTDPQFLRGYRDHHQKPPVLGLVMGGNGEPFFRSSLSPPDLIPHEHFFPPDILNLYMELMGCRHGRILFFDRRLFEVMVWDPATGCRRCVAVPPVFDDKEIVVVNGAVLCAAGDKGHVHGDCHSSPFQVVLIGIHRYYKRLFASVYSSGTGIWGDLISADAISLMYDLTNPGTLIGRSLYWSLDDEADGILEFDLDRHSLVNTEMPDLTYHSSATSLQIMPTDDSSSIGLAVLEYQKLEMWERKVDRDDVAGWVLQKTFQMNTILGLGRMGGMDNLMLGYDEDDHAIYIRTDIGVCIIQLETMQFRNLGKDNFTATAYCPYKSFYTAVSDLSVCETRAGGISRSLSKDGSIMVPASRGAGAVGDNAAAASTRTIPEGDMLGKSNSRVQGYRSCAKPGTDTNSDRRDIQERDGNKIRT